MTSAKKAAFFIIYAGLMTLIGVKLYPLCSESKKTPEIDTEAIANREQVLTPGNIDALLQEKAAERFREETDSDGLMIHLAFFGEREELARFARIRRGENHHADMSNVRDLTTPMRFWVNQASLELGKGSKPFLRQGMDALEHPALLIVYQLGREGQQVDALFDEGDHILLGRPLSLDR